MWTVFTDAKPKEWHFSHWTTCLVLLLAWVIVASPPAGFWSVLPWVKNVKNLSSASNVGERRADLKRRGCVDLFKDLCVNKRERNILFLRFEIVQKHNFWFPVDLRWFICVQIIDAARKYILNGYKYSRSIILIN